MKRILGSLLALVLLACESDLPVQIIEQDQPDLAISDATHGGGRAGFYFLPPLAPNPIPTGVFDPSLLPLLSVEICEWSGGACGAPVATFDATGTGSETIRLDHDAEHYSNAFSFPDLSG